MSSGALAGAGIAGSAVNAYGQLQTARAQSDLYNFNAQVSEQNALIAEQKGRWAAETGNQDVAASQMKTAAKVGSIKANQGASGVEIGTGSNADVITSTKEIGALDALTIRSNAARQAYGYTTEAYSDRTQEQLDKMAADNSTKAGYIGAGTTLLSGVAKGEQYYNHLNNNSIL